MKEKGSGRTRKFLSLIIVWMMMSLCEREIQEFHLGHVLFETNSATQSCSSLCDPVWLQHARLPCQSPIPGACSNSCPLSRWCHPTISSSVIPFLLLPSIFPSIRVFSNETDLYIRWPKYWSFSFSISPSNEYSGLISFRMDWLDLLKSKGLTRVFSNTTVQKYQFFCAQFSL